MGKCPKCNGRLMICKSYYETKNGDTPDLETEAYIVQQLVCINEKCENYAGTNLNYPAKIVDTVKKRLTLTK